MTTISLCMIVKNEENYLQNCLASVKDVVDEFIIVDTGSTDNTKEIAEKFGAKVIDFTWQDDFSTARNYSLEHATKDWILWLDADETLEKIDIDNLKERLTTTEKIAFEIEIHNLTFQDKTPFVHKSIRLFKNHSNIAFINKVHEQPAINENSIPNYDLATLSGHINHIGYREDVVKEKNKEERNFNILKEELKKNPHDRFLHFNIANEYLKKEEYHNALYHYKVATNNRKDHNMLSHSLLRMVLSLYELERYEEMFSLLEEGQKKYPDYTDIFYFKADILEKFGREEEAKFLYESCLKKGNPKKKYVTRQGVGDLLPLKKLSYLYLKSGNYKKAANSLLETLSLNKYDIQAAISLMRLYKLNYSEFDLEMVINELYGANTENDRRLKLEIAYTLRLRNLFIIEYSNLQDELPASTKKKYDLFYYLSIEENDIARELLLSNEYEQTEYIQYYLMSKDASISEYVNEDFKKIIQYLQTNNRKEAFNLGDALYIPFVEEALCLNDEESLSALLELQVLFSPVVKGNLGHVFYSHLHYNLANEFFIKFLITNEDNFPATLMVAELFLLQGQEIDALKYAHKAMLLNNEHFKSLEIILEVYKALGEVEQAKEVAKEMKKHFPYDHYLSQF